MNKDLLEIELEKRLQAFTKNFANACNLYILYPIALGERQHHLVPAAMYP